MTSSFADHSPRRPAWQDLTLRAGGGALWILAWLAGSALQARADHHLAAGAIDAVLALTAFLAGSAGSAAVVMGAHLFDRVAIAERWRATGRR